MKRSFFSLQFKKKRYGPAFIALPFNEQCKRFETTQNNIQFFSTMKMTQNHAVSKNNKLVKALYRNLLRWCDDIEVQTNNDVEPIPLEPMPPPITLLPYSNVDVSLLADLAAYVEHKQKNSVQKFNKVQNQKFYDRRELLSHISSLLPPNSTVDPKRLTLHVTNLQNIRNAIQVGFKMSSSSTKDSGIWQEQINMGFDTLRNLKEHIQPILEERWKQRQYHLKRDGIHFCVGQGKHYCKL